jgi:signal transduction histidine kinase/ActR/RegA family two-component response regulator
LVYRITLGDVRLGSRARAAIVAGFAALVLAGLGAIVFARSTAEAESWASHSLQVRQAQTVLLGMAQNAETGQRGYLLTGDLSYLAPFEQAEERLPGLEQALSQFVADNPAQQQRAASLAVLIGRKMRELEGAVTLRKAGDAEAALAIVRTNEGRDLMTQIRAESERFDQAELQLLAERQSAVALQRGLMVGLIVLALLSAGALAYFVGTETRRHARQLADKNLMLQQEVAERHRAEAQLRQAQKMEALGQLTGGVAHDFNNMLAIIVGNLDMLIRSATERDGRLRVYAENALSGAKRAASLTQRLLAFSRLQPLDPKPTDVNKCVKDMSEMLRRALGEQISIETVLGGGLWRGFVDAPQLESAILNLAVNARDAMPGGGRLTIETSNTALDQAYTDSHIEVEPGQYVLVAITDTGHGMSPEIMEKAFDPFFTTKRLGEGTGLGLSQVHGFLKQSRGHIKLYSEVGVGTTVKLYIPRDAGGAVVAVPTAAHQSPAIEGRFTVLVVEDNPDVRSFAVAAARELGFTVIEADSAAIALEQLSRHPEISVMLTDVVMPVTNGRQLVDAAAGLYPSLRVIYMTGYTRNAIVHNGVLDTGTRLLTKPFTLDQLDRELRDVLADAWPAERHEPAEQLSG